MSTPKHTPGPWKWFGNSDTGYYLATVHGGRRHVMTFARKGFHNGQPCFQPGGEHVGMIKADELCIYEVGDRGVIGRDAAKKNDTVYRRDINGFACADAELIAAAPELAECLRDAVDEFECLMAADNNEPEWFTLATKLLDRLGY